MRDQGQRCQDWEQAIGGGKGGEGASQCWHVLSNLARDGGRRGEGKDGAPMLKNTVSARAGDLAVGLEGRGRDQEQRLGAQRSHL